MSKTPLRKRARDLAFIADHINWPRWPTLPMKRRVDGLLDLLCP